MEELEIGAVMDGVITNVSKYGVFVDLGTEHNGIVNGLEGTSRQWRVGDCVSCMVETVDLEKRRCSVKFVDPMDWLAKNRMPLDQLKVGSMVCGAVTNVSDYGVFVNFRSAKDGRISLPSSLHRFFFAGQFVHGLQLAHVDSAAQRVKLTMDNAKEHISNKQMVSVANFPLSEESGSLPPFEPGAEPPMRQKPQARRHGASAVREANAADAPNMLSVGAFVDGVIVSITNRGVEVDIDGGIRGNLRVAPELAEQFMEGDRVQGMKVERTSNGKVTVSMDDPELELQKGSKGKAKGKGRPQPARPQPAKSRPAPGVLVNGTVTSIEPHGVVTKIDEDLEGVLIVPEELKEEFMVGDQVQGMRVDRISDDDVIVLSMDCPELDVKDDAAGDDDADAEELIVQPGGRGKGASRRAA